jgi:acyl-CoA synthetase (AMP-forming)/AMP-acid ligase II
MSQRNSPAAICSMLRKVSCHKLFATTASLGPLLEDVKFELAASDYPLEIDELPILPDIYPHFTHETSKDPFESISLPSRDVFVDGVVMYIHSSGSTGFPKPIPYRHEIFTNFTFRPYCDEYRHVREDLRAVQSHLFRY